MVTERNLGNKSEPSPTHRSSESAVVVDERNLPETGDPTREKSGPKLEICARLRRIAKGERCQLHDKTADVADEAAAIIEMLVGELEAARGIFLAYEALHLEKGTEDGNAKAKRNGAFAASIERTLATARQTGSEPPLSPYPETGSGDE
jgi:hypothetical protein